MFEKNYIFKEDLERNSIRGKIRALFGKNEAPIDPRLEKLHNVEKTLALKVYEAYSLASYSCGVWSREVARRVAWDYFIALPDVVDVVEDGVAVFGECYVFDKLFDEAMDLLVVRIA